MSAASQCCLRPTTASAQLYFQRYISHLLASGEIVLVDRSWYNRAGIERVMDFCTDKQYEEFFRTVPEVEKMLARSGMQLIEYWFIQSLTNSSTYAFWGAGMTRSSSASSAR